MNWFIEITGTSLSEEAKRICKINGIYSIEQLVMCYLEDNELKTIEGAEDAYIQEIISFVNKLLAFFGGISQDLKSEDNSPVNELADFNGEAQNKKPIENLSIDQLLEKELIDSRIYNVCHDNEISDLSEIFMEYSRKGTFRHFRNSGLKNDKRLKSLFDDYELRDKPGLINKSPERNVNDPKENSFQQYISGLAYGDYSLSKSIIEPIFECKEEQLFLFLLRFYYDLDNMKRVGSGKKEQSRKLIQNYFSAKKDLNEKQVKFISIVFKLIDSPFYVDISELWESYNKSVQSLIFQLFKSYSKFRIKDNKDYLYINKFMCFYEGVDPFSYNDMVDYFKSEMDEVVPLDTIKAQLSRTRKKVRRCFEEICNVLEKVYILESLNLTRGGNHIILSGSKLEALNSGMEKRLSREYYRYLLSTVLEDNYTDIGKGKTIKTWLKDSALYFIRNKYYNTFNQSVSLFEKLYSLGRDESEYQDITQFLESDTLDDLREVFLTYLENEYEGVKIENDKIVLLPNKSNIPRNIDLIIDIFKEVNKPIDYNELVEIFDTKHPGRRSSNRSLRDIMFRSDKTISLGGRSNKFMLKAWEDKYVVGHHKELVINHFKRIKTADHFYNIYLSIKDQREEISLKAVRSTLAMFSFFISEKGGYYYYADYPPKSSNQFTKNRAQLNNVIEAVDQQELMNDRENTILKLSDKYPEFSKIQFEYAIDFMLGNIE